MISLEGDIPPQETSIFKRPTNLKEAMDLYQKKKPGAIFGKQNPLQKSTLSSGSLHTTTFSPRIN
jgi:hypothetical protein